jgi:hypothetical protein
MKAITKPVLGAVIEIRVLKQTSAIYFCSTYSLIALLASLSCPKPVRTSYKTRIIVHYTILSLRYYFYTPEFDLK